MPYCLLLNNVYRIGDVFFRSVGTVPRFEIRFCICTPDFNVICKNYIGEIIGSKILFAGNGGSLLKSDEVG